MGHFSTQPALFFPRDCLPSTCLTVVSFAIAACVNSTSSTEPYHLASTQVLMSCPILAQPKSDHPMFNKGFLCSLLTPEHLTIYPRSIQHLRGTQKPDLPSPLQWISFLAAVLQGYPGLWSLFGFISSNQLWVAHGLQEDWRSGQERQGPQQSEPQTRFCHKLGGGHGNPFQYSCLENSMDRGAWQVHGGSMGLQRVRYNKPLSTVPAQRALPRSPLNMGSDSFLFHSGYSWMSDDAAATPQWPEWVLYGQHPWATSWLGLVCVLVWVCTHTGTEV